MCPTRRIIRALLIGGENVNLNSTCPGTSEDRFPLRESLIRTFGFRRAPRRVRKTASILRMGRIGLHISLTALIVDHTAQLIWRAESSTVVKSHHYVNPYRARFSNPEIKSARRARRLLTHRILKRPNWGTIMIGALKN